MPNKTHMTVVRGISVDEDAIHVDTSTFPSNATNSGDEYLQATQHSRYQNLTMMHHQPHHSMINNNIDMLPSHQCRECPARSRWEIFSSDSIGLGDIWPGRHHLNSTLNASIRRWTLFNCLTDQTSLKNGIPKVSGWVRTSNHVRLWLQCSPINLASGLVNLIVAKHQSFSHFSIIRLREFEFETNITHSKSFNVLLAFCLTVILGAGCAVKSCHPRFELICKSFQGEICWRCWIVCKNHLYRLNHDGKMDSSEQSFPMPNISHNRRSFCHSGDQGDLLGPECKFDMK